jgi:hypothetical protein
MSRIIKNIPIFYKHSRCLTFKNVQSMGNPLCDIFTELQQVEARELGWKIEEKDEECE